MKLLLILILALTVTLAIIIAAPDRAMPGANGSAYRVRPSSPPDPGHLYNPLDEGGETCADAVEFFAIPFVDSGNTCDNINNYNVPGYLTGGRDVVYKFMPVSPQCVDIWLCNSAYTTLLEVYRDSCTGGPIAANAYGCGIRSFIIGLNVLPPHDYYIVVDGLTASFCGEYVLEVDSCQPYEAQVPCPADARYGQPPYNVITHLYLTSDASPGYTCFENFESDGTPICGLGVWGTFARFQNGNWIGCNDSLVDFNIGFYQDNNHWPGDPLGTYTVTPTREFLRMSFFPEYDFWVQLDPCVELSGDSWVSVQASSGADPGCVWFWSTSPVGDGTVLLNSITEYSNLAYCLFPALSTTLSPDTPPKDYALLQNYPNPFNASTLIAYELPTSGHVSLRLFDLLGRGVAMLKDGWVEAGTHSVTFDGSSLASGIYFARLEAGEFTQTKKLMLLK